MSFFPQSYSFTEADPDEIVTHRRDVIQLPKVPMQFNGRNVPDRAVPALLANWSTLISARRVCAYTDSSQEIEEMKFNLTFDRGFQLDAGLYETETGEPD